MVSKTSFEKMLKLKLYNHQCIILKILPNSLDTIFKSKWSFKKVILLIFL